MLTSTKILFILVWLGVCGLALAQDPNNAYWSDKFGYPSLTGLSSDVQRGPVHAVYNDTAYMLCIQCEFGQSVYGDLIKFDGKNILPFRPNSPNVQGVVYCMSIDSAGVIYIGGDFDSVDGKSIKNLARWYNNEWTGMGIGPNASVHAMACSNKEVFISGPFDSIDQKKTGGLVRWDGSQFYSLDTLIIGESISKMVVLDSLMFAQGMIRFSNSNQRYIQMIWDGVAHRGISARGMDGRVTDMDVVGSDLYVCGSFDSIEGIYAPLIAKFNGVTWSRVGSMVPKPKFQAGASYIEKMEFGNGNIYCTGHTIIDGTDTLENQYKFDGTRWLQGAPIMKSSFMDLNGKALIRSPYIYLTDSTFLFTGLANFEDPFIHPFQDTSQHGINPQNEGPVYLASDAQNLYVRYVHSVGGTILTDYEYAVWNGGAWSVSTINDSVKVATPVLTGSGGDMFLHGHFQTFGKDKRKTSMLARWDGQVWHMYYDSAFNNRYKQEQLNFAKVYVMNKDFIYAIGADNSLHQRGLFRWRDNAWNEVTFPEEITQTPEMYAFDDTIIYFMVPMSVSTSAGPYYTFNIYKWDSHTLTNLTEYFRPSKGAVGDTVGADAYVMMAHKGKLYVGGYFSHFGDTISHNIIFFDGMNWRSMGDGCMFDDPYTYLQGVSGHIGVNNIVGYGSDVIAAGQFSGPAKLRTNSIARWDGSNWFTLGSGVIQDKGYVRDQLGEVRGMTLLDNNLYVVGEFTRAGGKIAHQISYFSLPPIQGRVENQEQSTHELVVYPNPSNGVFTFNTPDIGNIIITDLLGRIVWQGIAERGSTRVDCSGLPEGYYVVTVQYSNGVIHKGKFILR